jgi:hypothetical protein
MVLIQGVRQKARGRRADGRGGYSMLDAGCYRQGHFEDEDEEDAIRHFEKTNPSFG